MRRSRPGRGPRGGIGSTPLLSAAGSWWSALWMPRPLAVYRWPMLAVLGALGALIAGGTHWSPGWTLIAATATVASWTIGPLCFLGQQLPDSTSAYAGAMTDSLVPLLLQPGQPFEMYEPPPQPGDGDWNPQRRRAHSTRR